MESQPEPEIESEPAGSATKPRRDAVFGIVLAAIAAMLLWPILIGLYIYFFH